jgi:DNA polymerase III subunit epsilon
MRQVILDTETTGLEPELGHRIIEIGCIEVVNRRVSGRTFHRYVNPEREVDEGALAVHGISRAELEGKPRFADVAQELLEFISGAELVIHNASFDVSFLDSELQRLAGESRRVASLCRVLDTLSLAREMHPGQRNGLDALCKRYGVDDSRRELHGALLDAQLLAEVYLAMTGGQATLALSAADARERGAAADAVRALVRPSVPLVILRIGEEALRAHEAMLETIARASGGECVWRRMEEGLRASGFGLRAGAEEEARSLLSSPA